MVDSNATIEWNKAVIRLTAPKTGTYAGIAIFGARVETDNLIEETTADIHGVFYMPNGAFEWINAGEPVITAKWTAWVIDGVTWTGSGTIRYNFRPDDSDIPYPDALRVIPRPGKARLIN